MECQRRITPIACFQAQDFNVSGVDSQQVLTWLPQPKGMLLAY